MSAAPQIVIVIAAGRSGSKYLRGLLAASAASVAVPYDVNFVWRYGNERAEDDVLEPGSLDAQQRRWIRRRILHLSGYRPGKTAQIVVEKSVPNSLRVPFVREIFPEAKLVHLVRDGRAVCESARRVWNERPSLTYSLRKLRYMPPANLRYAVSYAANLLRRGDREHSARSWGPRYPGMRADLTRLPLLEVCAWQWRECVRRASHAFAEIPPDQSMTVRFEDLVHDEAVLARLADFAGIPDTQRVAEHWRATTDASNVDKWRRALDPASTARLTAVLREELESFGYPTADDDRSADA